MPSTPRTPVAAMVVLASLAGCAATGDRGQPLVPTAYQTRTGPYVVFTNYPLPADDGVIRQLTALKTQFEETLGLKVEGVEHPIEVYVLTDRKAFEHFLTFYYPGLPPRRAFFIAQGDRRVVYTFKSDRLDEDIRHEATHALIHLAVGSIPLWLDEGLAEHFEVTDATGLNREHLARLPQDLRDGLAPSIQRLETLQGVQQMSPRDYRESWAWVHYLLHGSGEGRAILLAYLGDLRGQGEVKVKPLSQRLASDGGELVARWKAHVDEMQTISLAKAAQPGPADSVRFQDRPIEVEPVAPAPRKLGFFGRLFGRANP